MAITHSAQQIFGPRTGPHESTLVEQDLTKAPWCLQGMPVVQTGRGARQVMLLARSIDEYLHRRVPHLRNSMMHVAGLMHILALSKGKQAGAEGCILPTAAM